jgi:SAM-dependent methyltransferase
LKIIPEFYESEVFEGYAAFHEFVGTRLGENHKAFFKYFPSNVRGKLLDVGCGDGRFLRCAKEQGFEVWGIDFDKKSVENVKRNLGIDTVFAMSLEEFYEYAKEKNLKFDVITFFEVLEHQDKPGEFLEMVKGLLKEGGYIAGSVPNRERLFVETDWKYYDWDYPPHHFLRFSKFSLYRAFKNCGFTNIELYTLKYPYGEFISRIEKILLGKNYKHFHELRIMIKRLLTKDEKKAKYNSLDEIEGTTYNKGFVSFLKVLRIIKNCTLMTLRVCVNIYKGLKNYENYKIYLVLFQKILKYEITDEEIISMDIKGSSNILGKIKNFLLRFYRLLKIKKEISPDVCISFLESADFLNLITKFGKHKVVLTIHNTMSEYFKQFYDDSFFKKFASFVYNNSYKFLAKKKLT